MVPAFPGGSAYRGGPLLDINPIKIGMFPVLAGYSGGSSVARGLTVMLSGMENTWILRLLARVRSEITLIRSEVARIADWRTGSLRAASTARSAASSLASGAPSEVEAWISSRSFRSSVLRRACPARA